MVAYLPIVNAQKLLVILEEANQKQSSNEDLIYSSIFLTGAVGYSLLTIFQVASSLRFYWHTRSLKEVGWMLHFINLSVIISHICLGGYFWLLYEQQSKSSLVSVGAIGYRLLIMVNYWFMIRLIRVQVQIMSEKEYTKIIMKKMRQSKVFEWIMLTLLSVNSASVFLYFLPKDLEIQSIGKILYSIFYGPSQIVFVTIFYFQMSKVNEQLDRLFK